MFGTIRKHQGWLWWIIIVVVVCSFVVFFAPSSKFSNGQQRRGDGEYRGSIDDQEITEGEWRQAQNEAYLRYFLQRGQWPDRDAEKSGFKPDDQTYQQLLLIRKLEQFNIEPDPVAVAQTADNLIRQFTQGKPTDISTFVREHLGSNVSPDDFERFLRHDVAIRQLVSVVGLSGQLVTPEDARAVYERERRERVTQVAFFPATNYLNSVVVNSNLVADFYSRFMANYHVNERRQVSYVAFPVTNFFGRVEKEFTNLNEAVESNLQQLGTNYTRFAKTPGEAKIKVREELLRQRALTFARQQANEFAAVLFEMKPERPENLAQLARTNGLTVKITEPFEAETGPTDLNVGQDFTKAAFALSPTDDPFRGPLIGEDAVYVIAFDKQLADEILPLQKIHDRVVEDYKYNQAATLARQAGSKFAQSLAGALEQGKTFAEICVTNKLKPVTMPPLSLSMRELPEIEEHIGLPNYKQFAFGTRVGKASNLVPTRNGGMVVYVDKELPIDPRRMEEEMPRFVTFLRQQREQEAFYDWFNKQADKSLHRPKPPAQTQTVGRS